MTPLQEIKQGIENRDMRMVASGYSRMTGEIVKIPVYISPTDPSGVMPDKFLDIRGIHRRIAIDIDIDKEKQAINEEHKKYCRKESIVAGNKENKFVDNFGDIDNASKFDQLVVAKVRPSARNREPYVEHLVEVECAKCEKMYKINSYEKTEHQYVCLKCIRNAKQERD